jgi:hypothetical protein
MLLCQENHLSTLLSAMPKKLTEADAKLKQLYPNHLSTLISALPKKKLTEAQHFY